MQMMIFNENGQKIGVLQNYTSIQWKRKYAEPGQFEIHVRPTKENLANIKEGITRFVNQATQEIGFVSFFHDEESEDEAQGDIEIRGYMDNLDQRINIRTWHFGTNVESDVMDCIQFNQRDLDIYFVPDPQGLQVSGLDMESTWATLRDTVQLVCEQTGLGYRMLADKLAGKSPEALNQFGMYNGKKRNVKFSDKLSNITFQSVVRDLSDYKNFAYVCAQGEGEERTVVEVDLSNGGERYELYVDSRNTSKKYTDESGNEQTYTDEEYQNVLHNEGLEALAEHSAVIQFSVTIDPNDPLFRFRIDYDLGDIVIVESVKYNIQNTLYRISGINEIEEDGVETIEIELTLYAEEASAKKGVTV